MGTEARKIGYGNSFLLPSKSEDLKEEDLHFSFESAQKQWEQILGRK